MVSDAELAALGLVWLVWEAVVRKMLVCEPVVLMRGFICLGSVEELPNPLTEELEGAGEELIDEGKRGTPTQFADALFVVAECKPDLCKELVLLLLSPLDIEGP